MNWKDYFLKSGIPLEREIQKILNENNISTREFYSYFKEDENGMTKEFSYDIGGIYNTHSFNVNLMIECKYRYNKVNWIFIPKYYEYDNNVEEKPNVFHIISDLVPKKTHKNIEKGIDSLTEIGPLCSKGIEIGPNGKNEKSIESAISQISYAMAYQYVDSMEYLLKYDGLFTEKINSIIPIIVTTAKLYRLKEDMDLQQIQSAKNIEEIAVNNDILILKNFTSKHLKNYNRDIFNEFKDDFGKKKLMRKFNCTDIKIELLLDTLASYCCPGEIVVIHYDPIDKSGMMKFIDYLKESINTLESGIDKR